MAPQRDPEIAPSDFVVPRLRGRVARDQIASISRDFSPSSIPQLRFHEPTYLPYGGTHRGVAETQTLFAKVNDYLDLATIKVDHLLAEADHTVATVRINVRRVSREMFSHPTQE